MNIQFDAHVLKRALERGRNEKEIADVMDSGLAVPAKYGRLGKAKVYDFKQKRQEKHYEQKRVDVFYATEENLWVIVTVYVFYGQWEA